MIKKDILVNLFEPRSNVAEFHILDPSQLSLLDLFKKCYNLKLLIWTVVMNWIHWTVLILTIFV